MNLPVATEAMFGLAGAIRLARFDATGLAFLPNDGGAAARSYIAWVLVIPGYIALTWLNGELARGTAGPDVRMVVEVLRYVINAAAFPVIVSFILDALGGSERFPRFLVAYNWSVPVQMSVYLPAEIIVQGNWMPQVVSAGLLIGVSLAMLSYEVFIIRVTLRQSWAAAAVFAALDLVVSMVIGDMADMLLR